MAAVGSPIFSSWISIMASIHGAMRDMSEYEGYRIDRIASRFC